MHSNSADGAAEAPDATRKAAANASALAAGGVNHHARPPMPMTTMAATKTVGTSQCLTAGAAPGIAVRSGTGGGALGAERALAAALNGLPHSSQKAAPSSFRVPHAVQNFAMSQPQANLCPQLAQKT